MIRFRNHWKGSVDSTKNHDLWVRKGNFLVCFFCIINTYRKYPQLQTLPPFQRNETFTAFTDFLSSNLKEKGLA